MADSLKVKIGIAVFAMLILVLIPLLETKFFATVTVRRWGPLSWDDFQGIPQPFSSYEAEISSAIYLEYDSALGRHVAYAGQNNVKSWAKRSPNTYLDYALNHEQYHFNITELYARRLNEYIDENPDGTLQLYLLRLGSLNIDLKRMQRQYDEETNHSLVYDKQRNWEYRIDSLLMLKKGWLTDHFSGAQVYLTHPSDSSKGLIDGLPYRHFAQYTYGMQLSLTSYQASKTNNGLVVASIKRNIEKRSERLKAISIDTTNFLRVFTVSEDTSNYTYYQLWVANNSYLYQIKTRYPNNTGDTTGYARIASSFINSFHVTDTDSYWITKLEASASPITFYNVKQYDGVKRERKRYCITIGPDQQRGFFRGPFYRDDGAMFLAYDYLVHADTLHLQDILLLKNEWYSNTPTNQGQVYFLPADKIPTEKYNIKFGYILLQDSVKECYEFYHQDLEVTPQNESVKSGL